MSRFSENAKMEYSVRIVDIYNDYRIHSASVETAETVNAANGSSFLFESNANFAIVSVSTP